jgi:DNA-directed RNA polymerase beta subunit
VSIRSGRSSQGETSDCLTEGHLLRAIFNEGEGREVRDTSLKVHPR